MASKIKLFLIFVMCANKDIQRAGFLVHTGLINVIPYLISGMNRVMLYTKHIFSWQGHFSMFLYPQG